MLLVCVFIGWKSQSSKKKIFFEDWDFFLQNWEKRHLNSIGNGAELRPENTKKIPVKYLSTSLYKAIHRFQVIMYLVSCCQT